MTDDPTADHWLMLAYHFPKGPGSRRVRVWRRLQSIGALAIKKSFYLLPLNDQSHEDFEWLLAELRSSGADGVILESRFVDGMSDHEVRELFRAARDTDYAGLRDDVEAALAAFASEYPGEEIRAHDNARRALERARKRFTEIDAIDFFDAEGRAATEASIRVLDERSSDDTQLKEGKEHKVGKSKLDGLSGRVWVTRRGVGVDRIASAWLIRRWIDADARFKFVSARGYVPAEREIRFDMFAAEFTHEGDSCTFEVLAALAREADTALRYVGQIVHDIDLKDGKFARPETQGVANLLAGIVVTTDDDERRIERGGAIFEDLYQFFNKVHQ